MIQYEQFACPACGKPAKVGQTFCISCGFKLNEVICPSCGKIVKISQNFCISCGANLSELIKTEKISRAPTQLAISDKERAKLKQLIMLKRKKEIIRFIKNLFINYSYSLHEKIYDLIGEMLIENPEFFMKDLHRRLYKKFVYRGGRLFSPQLISEMEEYILRKFCFYKGEQIIIPSYGRLSIGIHHIHGNLYVTNRRLIATGIISKEGLDGGVAEHPGFLIILLIAALYIYVRGAITPWKKILSRQINEIKPCFGFEFPYRDVHNIKRKKKKIKFVLKYEYKDKGQTKIKTLKLRIVPLIHYSFKHKYESKVEFRKRREMALSKINEVLIKQKSKARHR